MIIEIITVAVSGFIIYKLRKESKSLRSELKTSLSKIKSLYVLHGQAIETVAPFSGDFEGDIRELNFLGMPIDFIGFHEDGIVFYEVKSGLSQLSPKQKRIKKHVESGRIRFKEVRY